MTDTQYEIGWYHDKVREQAAEIERWKLTVALRDAEIERLQAALQALADDTSVPPWIRTLALESKP